MRSIFAEAISMSAEAGMKYTDMVKKYFEENPGAKVDDPATQKAIKEKWNAYKKSEGIQVGIVIEALKLLPSQIDKLPEEAKKKLQNGQVPMLTKAGGDLKDFGGEAAVLVYRIWVHDPKGGDDGAYEYKTLSEAEEAYPQFEGKGGESSIIGVVWDDKEKDFREVIVKKMKSSLESKGENDLYDEKTKKMVSDILKIAMDALDKDKEKYKEISETILSMPNTSITGMETYLNSIMPKDVERHYNDLKEKNLIASLVVDAVKKGTKYMYRGPEESPAEGYDDFDDKEIVVAGPKITNDEIMEISQGETNDATDMYWIESEDGKKNGIAFGSDLEPIKKKKSSLEKHAESLSDLSDSELEKEYEDTLENAKKNTDRELSESFDSVLEQIKEEMNKRGIKKKTELETKAGEYNIGVGDEVTVFGEEDPIGTAVAVGTAQEMVDQDYDSTGATAEFIETSGYDQLNSKEEAAKKPAVAVELFKGDEGTVVWIIGEGGAFKKGKLEKKAEDYSKLKQAPVGFMAVDQGLVEDMWNELVGDKPGKYYALDKVPVPFAALSNGLVQELFNQIKTKFKAKEYGIEEDEDQKGKPDPTDLPAKSKLETKAESKEEIQKRIDKVKNLIVSKERNLKDLQEANPGTDEEVMQNEEYIESTEEDIEDYKEELKDLQKQLETTAYLEKKAKTVILKGTDIEGKVIDENDKQVKIQYLNPVTKKLEETWFDKDAVVEAKEEDESISLDEGEEDLELGGADPKMLLKWYSEYMVKYKDGAKAIANMMIDKSLTKEQVSEIITQEGIDGDDVDLELANANATRSRLLDNPIMKGYKESLENETVSKLDDEILKEHGLEILLAFKSRLVKAMRSVKVDLNLTDEQVNTVETLYDIHEQEVESKDSHEKEFGKLIMKDIDFGSGTKIDLYFDESDQTITEVKTLADGTVVPFTFDSEDFNADDYGLAEGEFEKAIEEAKSK